ncbi:hypothetical protein BDZ94DRAFT_1276083 [Collybia nuda]|uniref:Uncharacterized protein n=1 Tax=Collybia nuda TaxID=64659 RepID=A0A9P6CBQ5_9AGAR|nr:hypothetical protein BDZ94DRAFT_1276083 [Collybia nuda]
MVEELAVLFAEEKERFRKPILERIEEVKKAAEVSLRVKTLEKTLETQARNAEIQAKRADAEAKNIEIHAKRADAEAKNAEIHAKRADAEAKSAEIHAKRADAEAKNAEIHARMLHESEERVRQLLAQLELERAQRAL